MYRELRVEKQLCKGFLDWQGRLIRSSIRHRARFLKKCQENCTEPLLSPGAPASADRRWMQSSLKIVLVQPHGRAKRSATSSCRDASAARRTDLHKCVWGQPGRGDAHERKSSNSFYYIASPGVPVTWA